MKRVATDGQPSRPPPLDVSPNVGAPRRRAGTELQPTPLAAAATRWQASSTTRVGPVWRGGDFGRRPSAPLWAGDLLGELRRRRPRAAAKLVHQARRGPCDERRPIDKGAGLCGQSPPVTGHPIIPTRGH